MSLPELVRGAKRVYVIGNGGSYANASHIINDLLNVGVRAFTIDPATLSAFANDYGWETALERWIGIVGEPGDLLIAMSGSGKSPNILRAAAAAEKIGMTVWREFGAQNGLNMQQAEELQVWWGHHIAKELR